MSSIPVNIPACVPPLWTILSPTGIHKDNETSSGDTEADWYLSGQYPNCSLIKGRTISAYSQLPQCNFQMAQDM